MKHNYIGCGSNSAHWAVGCTGPLKDKNANILVQLGDSYGRQIRIGMSIQDAELMILQLKENINIIQKYASSNSNTPT